MNIEIEDVKNTIRAAVEQHTGVRVMDDDKNLFSDDLNPIIPNYLYVLKDVEEQYGTIIYRILECHNYTVFTINQLAKEIVASASRI